MQGFLCFPDSGNGLQVFAVSSFGVKGEGQGAWVGCHGVCHKEYGENQVSGVKKPQKDKHYLPNGRDHS